MGELEEHVLRSRLAGRHDAQTFAELIDHGWSPRDVRLALVRVSQSPTSQGPATPRTAVRSTVDPYGRPGPAPAWTRAVLPAATLLAAIPTVTLAVVALPVLLAVVVIFAGASASWATSSVLALESVVTAAPWLMISYLVAIALLVVHLARRRPRDPWGRPAPRPRSTRVLSGLTVGMLVATPLLVAGGFVLFLMVAVVCGETPRICR